MPTYTATIYPLDDTIKPYVVTDIKARNEYLADVEALQSFNEDYDHAMPYKRIDTVRIDKIKNNNKIN